MTTANSTTTRLRIPTKDDAFIARKAGRMFELLSGVDNHPPGCPINEALRLEIKKLFTEAYKDGIDIIGVSECGLRRKPTTVGKSTVVNNPTTNHFIDQSRQDLAGGWDPSIILNYARHHIGAMRNLTPSKERNDKIAQAEAFAIELEEMCK